MNVQESRIQLISHTKKSRLDRKNRIQVSKSDLLNDQKGNYLHYAYISLVTARNSELFSR